MTRDEFLDNIEYFSELIDFCQEYGCDYLDDVYDDDSRDEEINYCVSEYGNDYSWYDLRDLLHDIPTGYDYYRQNGSFDWDGLDDDDFQSYKDDVYEWAVDNDIFDEGYDPFEEDEEPEEEEDNVPLAEEDFSIGELMHMSSSMLISIRSDETKKMLEADAKFNEYVAQNMPKQLA